VATATQSFAASFKRSDALSVSYKENWTLSDIQERVRLGQDDAGVILAGDVSDSSAPSIIIVSEPSRDIAATVLKGQILQMLSDNQGSQSQQIFTTVSALNSDGQNTMTDQSVTYYIGATAILFLLFSAMQGASLSLDERKSGISDRLLVGPMGALKILTGKFVFLTLIGFFQAAIIVVVAGSMVPRFMMPDWLQGLGQITPNAYAIDAVYGILARGQSLSDLLPIWGVLFGGAAICLALAAITSHTLRRV